MNKVLLGTRGRSATGISIVRKISDIFDLCAVITELFPGGSEEKTKNLSHIRRSQIRVLNTEPHECEAVLLTNEM
jgi:hypothetical protein